MPRGLVALLLAAAVCVGMPATQAAAADDSLTWSVRPADNANGTDRPNFVYQAEPGQVIADALVVTNHGDEQLTLQVYAADAFTTSSGQLDLLAAGEPSSGAGTWVRVDLDQVTLDPGATQEVPFTVTVPADASPGDHSGGVVTSFVSEQPGTTVNLDSRLGSRMHVRVGGELSPALEVSDVTVVYANGWNPFGPSSATVRYTVTNTGNARMTATEVVGVTGPAGRGAVGAPLAEIPELLPGTTLLREVQVDGVWPLLRADAGLELLPVSVGAGGQPIDPIVATASTWAVPWALLAAIGLVVVVSVWGPALLRRRREPAAPRLRADETGGGLPSVSGAQG